MVAIDAIILIMALSIVGLFISMFLYSLNMMGKEVTESIMNTSEFIIRKPKTASMGLFCCVLAMACLGVISLDCSITSIFIASLICILFSISYFRWKVIVKGNQITFTPHLGKTKSFTFSDITDVKRRFISKTSEYVVKIYYSIENKQYSFSIAENDLCYYVFISRLEEEGIHINDAKKRKCFF